MSQVDKIVTSASSPKPATSRQDLLNRADQYIINQFADLTFDSIDCYQKGTLIHTTKVRYEDQASGFPNLAEVDGYLFPEIWEGYIVNNAMAQAANDIVQTQLLVASLLGSTITKTGTGKISYIQAAMDDEQNGSLLPTFSVAPTAGNFLYAFVFTRFAGAPPTVTGINQQDVTWTKQNNKTDGFNLNVEIWQGVVQTGALNTAQITLSGGYSEAIAVVLEFAMNGAAADVSATNAGNGVVSDSGTTAATTQANELAVAAINCQSAQSAATNGYTPIYVTGVFGFIYAGVFFKFLTAIAAQDVSTTNAGNAFAGCITTFKAN